MLRIGLFLLTNIAVMVVFAVVINILAPLLGFQLTGGSLTGLLVMCFMYGMIGSLISLLLSKWLAKRSTGTQVIKQPTTQLEVWLVETVRRFVDKPLCELTPEEDFMLGALLGYDREQQCRRYLERTATTEQRRSAPRADGVAAIQVSLC